MRSHSRFSVRRWCVTLLGACAIQASAPEDAAAQVMQGSVIGANGEGPIATALVRLVDEDGEQVAITIADDRGRFRLEAPAPGSYRLQAERVGYRPAESFGSSKIMNPPALRHASEAGRKTVSKYSTRWYCASSLPLSSVCAQPAQAASMLIITRNLVIVPSS